MDLEEALWKAGQILDEERMRQTVAYVPLIIWQAKEGKLSKPFQSEQIGQFADLFSGKNLASQREKRPREVNEFPEKFVFESTNLELLRIIYSHLQQGQRETFVKSLLSRIKTTWAMKMKDGVYDFPSFMGLGSELPLLGEFCIRAGHTELLFTAIESMDAPTRAFLLLLSEIEDAIALSFNIFSEAELIRLQAIMLVVLNGLKFAKQKLTKGTIKVPETVTARDYNLLLGEMDALTRGIHEICRKARYLYLKGQMQAKANPEINLDRERVANYLSSLGFSKEMTGSLDAAESEYRKSLTPFELKNCLGHLRSFLEHLHRETVRSIAKCAGDIPEDSWGAATAYLRDNEYLSKKEQAYVTSLYTLISDESIHTLLAEQEYARLSRNVVIEYGLMFLTTLDKKGVKLQADGVQ